MTKPKVIIISPQECIRWKLADRSIDEFGNIHALAEDIRKNGQIEPILVRPISSDYKNTQYTNYKYEVIAGSRRWKACLEGQMDVYAIIQDLDDNESIIAQIKENEKLKLSDYSKGMSYHNILQNGTLKAIELANIVGISQTKLQYFLAFARIPRKILEAVGKKDLITARAAASIYSLSKKGDDYIEALCEIAQEIRKGAGSTTIENLVNDILFESKHTDSDNILLDEFGQIFAKWESNKLQIKKHMYFNKKKLNKHLIKFFVQRSK